jgi:hypothetical protein
VRRNRADHVWRQGIVDLLRKVYYNNFMARPRKDPKLRMGTDLRVPMTEDQKRLIVEATSDKPEGMAAWARAVLLQAAQRQLARRRELQER